MVVTPAYDYVLYVDEAGDAGVKSRSKGTGSTEWFVLGGVVVAKRHEAKITGWVRGVFNDIGHEAPYPDELHFNRLDAPRKLLAAQSVANLPLSAFTVLSHKENMREHVNKRAARIGGRNFLYNFCLRVLLERVTHTIARSSLKQFGEVRRLKIVIAQTGGVRYEQTTEYLEKLRAQAITGTTFLSTRVIHPAVASSWQFEPVSANNTAGCQLADAVVSAFYNSVNDKGAFPLMQEPAVALSPVVPRQNGTRARHGLTLLPWNEQIPEKYRPIFRQYGYHF